MSSRFFDLKSDATDVPQKGGSGRGGRFSHFVLVPPFWGTYKITYILSEFNFGTLRGTLRGTYFRHIFSAHQMACYWCSKNFFSFFAKFLKSPRYIYKGVSQTRYKISIIILFMLIKSLIQESLIGRAEQASATNRELMN